MGVKGLSKLIKPYIKQGSLTLFSNKKLGIDTSLYMHKFCNISYKLNGEGDIYNSVEMCFKNYTKKFTNNNIAPIYIFDNKSHNLKDGVIEDRIKNTKIKVVKKCFYTDIQEFFEKNNINYNISPELWEAEQYGAFLVKNKKIDGMITADLDCLVFGCEVVITNINRKNEIEYYILSEVLEKLDISYEKFLFMSIMMGTDFNPKGVKKFGPQKSLNFVKQNDIEKILDLLNKEIENFDEIYSLFIKTV